MGFHEVQFPPEISYGSRGGPGFDTLIFELDSGAEERVARKSTARRRYNAVEGDRAQSNMATIIDFYIARLGPANGFRWKDWSDYSTGANHTGAVSDADYQLGVGDGATVDFQLIKTYTSGSQVRTRKIQKPVAGTVKVSLDDVEQGSGWTVNTTTGIVTFSTAPTIGQVVKAGCEFDVPVRFGIELDEQLPVSIDSFDNASISDLPVVEIVNELGPEEEFYYGGAIDHGVITANANMTEAQGRVHVTRQTAAGLKLILPDYTLMPTGGPYFYVFNEGSTSIVIEDHAAVTVTTLAASGSAVLLLGLSSGVKKWFALG